MDIVLKYITEAQMYLKDYESNQFDEMVTESNREEISEKLKNNIGSQEKSVSSMKKAFSKLKEMIRTIMSSIRDFFDKMFINGREKEQFEKYNEMLKNDPNMAQTKITVQDFRKLNKVYDDAIKMANDARAKEMEPSYSEKIMDMVKKALPAVVTTIGMGAALKLASNNQTVAQVFNKQLKEQDGVVSELERLVGKKDTSNFKKKMDKATRDGWWARFTTSLIGKKAKANKEASNSISSAIMKVIKAKSPEERDAAKKVVMGKVMQDPKLSKPAGKAIETAGKAQTVKNSIMNVFKSKGK